MHTNNLLYLSCSVRLFLELELVAVEVPGKCRKLLQDVAKLGYIGIFIECTIAIDFQQKLKGTSGIFIKYVTFKAHCGKTYFIVKRPFFTKLVQGVKV